MCLLNLSEGSSFGDMGCQDSSYAIAQIWIKEEKVIKCKIIFVVVI